MIELRSGKLCLALASLAVFLTSGVALVSSAWAGRVADIKNTKHNLSSASTNTTRATGAQATIPGVSGTRAVGTSEVCVYCHTPHAAVTQDSANNTITPLWNRRVKPAAYTGYSSSTLDAVPGGVTPDPQGSSKLCLSCHDGTVAIGNVGVISGYQANLSGSGGSDTGIQIPFQGVETNGTMPVGPAGSSSGFTRRLGTNLSNDHPISISYTSTLAGNDGELRGATGSETNGTVVIDAATNSLNTNWVRQTFDRAVARRGSGYKPMLPLEPTGAGNPQVGQVQCGTCHDPHIRDTTASENIKFLRGQRLQKSTPVGGDYDAANDILCLACHDKAGNVWSNSVHANSTDANEAYKTETTVGGYNASLTRDLPTTTAVQVWQYACLNCHDTHTVPGARRLLREGIEGTYSTADVTGGTLRFKTAPATPVPAVEEVCFMCHRARADANHPLTLGTQTVPDIMSDFSVSQATDADASRMPIRSTEQCAGGEVHSIGDPTTAGSASPKAGKDFVEARSNLGTAVSRIADNCDSTSKRHVECTDCHNPHRMKKGNHAGQNGGTDIRGTAGGNAVSNVLLGTFGVDPDYSTLTDTHFGVIPTSFKLRCGSSDTAKYPNCDGAIQFEYQICLKCHSNYAYDDVNDPVGDGTHSGMYNYSGRPAVGRKPNNVTSVTAAARPQFDGAIAGTNIFPSGARYTNQAMEFWGPSSHKGEASATHTLTGTYALPDHRSWHPVMTSTGRTPTERGDANVVSNFLAPFNQTVGNQTIYCSDCHGSENAVSDGNSPAKYTTSGDTGIQRPWGPHGSKNAFILKGKYDNGNFDLCLRCHAGFAGNAQPTNHTSGFCCDKSNNLHSYHLSKMSGIKCNNCHIAVPHGWKHKALLADNRTVGNEVGIAADTDVVTNTGAKQGGTYAGKGYTQGPYYLNAMLRVRNWKRSGQWASSDCNPTDNNTGGGVGGMKSSCQNQ